MRIAVIVSSSIFFVLGCKEEGHCFYNCPDDPNRVCGEKVMGPDDKEKCENLAQQKCEENPEHLDDWDGGVVNQLVVCEESDPCGLPNWCLPPD